MKVLSLFLCCLANIIAVEITPLDIRQAWFSAGEPHFSSCAASSGVDSIEAYNSIMKNQWGNDSKLKCYMTCIAQKLNLMNSIGEFVEEEFVRQLKGVTSEMAKKCIAKTKNEEDLCKKGFDTFLCLMYDLGKPYDGKSR